MSKSTKIPTMSEMFKMAMMKQLLSALDGEEDEEDKPKMSFNETGEEVDSLRKGMLLYLSRQEGKSEMVEKSYRMRYSGGDDYFGIKYDSLVMKATSRLEAIIKFKDYFNEHAKHSEPFDAFEDFDLTDIICEYDDITDPGCDEMVFGSKHFGEIMERFIEHQFNNDNLWFEDCDSPPRKVRKSSRKSGKKSSK
jgi:hypothetical protein